jgi:hypothetical protein
MTVMAFSRQPVYCNQVYIEVLAGHGHIEFSGPKDSMSQTLQSEGAGSHRVRAFRKEENMLGIKQNVILQGNVK